MLGEETADPLRAIPKAILTAVVVALVYYVFVTWMMGGRLRNRQRPQSGRAILRRSTRWQRVTSETGSR